MGLSCKVRGLLNKGDLGESVQPVQKDWLGGQQMGGQDWGIAGQYKEKEVCRFEKEGEGQLSVREMLKDQIMGAKGNVQTYDKVITLSAWR